MKIYGYARVSTNKQNIERQVRNIQAAYGDAVIVRETFTATKFQGRAELEKLLKNIQAEDTIVFDSVSRMSRNADEGFALYEDLFHKGINLVFLKEPHINTETYRQAIENRLQIAFDSGDDATDELMTGIIDALNKYIMRLAQKQIQLAFSQSEKEVADLHQRTREGIITAKLNGKRIGQPKGAKLVTKKSIEAKEKIRKYNNTFGGTLNNEETWTLIKISKMTFYKYKNEMLAEEGPKD
jgi:DNA invertase Pin-like site-specific DNA recombinase